MASSRNSHFTDALRAACAACIAEGVSPGQHLVVGLSGGIDSVSLLHVLLRLGHEGDFRVSALHVHHGLSGNADDWADFSRQLCDHWEVPLSVVHVAVERDSADGLEAAARRARHEAYSREEGDCIVLAHHRGDQAETLLFNLLRGTGLAGAAAMASRQRRLLRPLLSVSRSDIEDYARVHDLHWVEDESNRDTGFSRNFLRHDILASLSQRFPAAEKNLAAATGRFAEAASLLDELAKIDLVAGATDFPIPVSLLAKLSEPRARNVLRYLLARRGVRIPSEARLIELLRQLLAAGPDRHPRVRFGDWDIVRRRGRIELEPAAAAP
ncbi:MAG: tRNA lysidine(34) synthetase TilS [Sulfuritalea sp.]|nr:tRNA lysidine(34) synthetase TilS [Sulfuritalea sp.]